jgi:hypothetical protein
VTDAAERAALEDEAREYGAALLAAPPDAYVAAQYARAHQHLPLQPATPFDHVLLELASRGPWALRAADGYSRFFAPASVLRRKLAVLVAILESAAPSDGAFAASAEPPVGVIVQLLVTGVGFALLLGVGILALAPQHLAARAPRDDE